MPFNYFGTFAPVGQFVLLYCPFWHTEKSQTPYELWLCPVNPLLPRGGRIGLMR